jgi:hypothetical protein
VRAGEPPPTPHVYFARTGQWALSVVPPNPVRIGGAALTSGSGSALYLGGRDASNENVLGADRFDPTTGVFEQLALLPARINGSAATLGDGRAILVGGVDHDDQIARHIDLISIDADSTQAVTEVEADQLGSISGPGLATLNDGTVVAFGGRGPAGQTIDLATRIASEGSSVVIETLEDARLAFPRYGHSMTRLSDDLGAPVLIAGGRDQNAMPVATSELYRPLFELVAPLSEFGKLMQVPRWDHAAVRLPDGGVLIVGGRNVSGPVGSLEVFTLEAGFIIRGFLPAGSGLTDFSVTSLPDGRVLIAGGRDSAGELVDTVQIVRIDPFNGGIDLLTTAKLSTERAGHTAALLCDGTVLVVGGTLEPTPAERYNPPSTGRL